MPFQEPLRAEVDGVPVWFTDVPGPCMGGLIFRVGRADEALSTHGISHTVEHLALRPLASAHHDMTGQVGALLTRFSGAGAQERVEWFMGQVCRSLAALPTDRLELERRILLTESRWRGSSFGDTDSVRFGANGFGLTDWAEMGLHEVSAGQIDDWRNAYFTRTNAVAWITRPPSAALRLELPSGPAPSVPEPQPLPDLVLPAHTHVDGLVVGCSLLAPRSMPLFVAMRVIRDRVFSTLRLERGLCYSVFDDDDRVGVRDSLFVTGCDVAEGHGAEVIEAFVGVLGSVAGGEITPEEVRDCLRVVDAVGILGSIAAGRRGRAEGGRRTARAHPRDLGRPGGPSGCLDRSRRRGELGGCARQRPARRAGGRGRPGSVRRGTRAATGSEGQRPALRAVGREHGRRGGARAGGREPGDRSERHHGGGLR